MQRVLFRLLLFSFFPLISSAQTIPGGLDTATLNVNRIAITLNNRGFLGESGGRGGVYWRAFKDSYNDNVIVYDAGMGVSGLVSGTLRHAVTHWGSTYGPGPIVGREPALFVNPQDAGRYRMYSIRAGDTLTNNIDLAEWPADLGAPVGAKGLPVLFGDQTVWTVYNGADTTARPSSMIDASNIPHLALEVRQTAYAREGGAADTSALANSIFIEYLMINKEPQPIDSAYFVFWTDVDFTNLLANVPGVDTSLQLGYMWSRDTYSPENNPSVGYLLLHGPVVPSPGDTALFAGHQRIGYRNLPMTAYWGMSRETNNDSSIAALTYTASQVWNVSKGKDRIGRTIINPVTGQPTTFTFSGDPVTGTGWVYNLPYYCFEAGFQFSSGPFTLASADSQWVMIALVPGIGGNRLQSITAMRRNAAEILGMPYESIAKKRSLGPAEHVDFIPGGPLLHMNYPNPFNAGTIIKYLVDKTGNVTLEAFNILGQKVATLVNEVKEAGVYETRFGPSNLASGVYICRLTTTGGVSTRKMMLLK
jgi:hypothetical protein